MMGTTNPDYHLVVDIDGGVLRAFSQITKQYRFEAIVKMAFQRLLALAPESFIYDSVHHILKTVPNVTDVKSLLSQAIAVNRHVQDEYRYLLPNMVYDSFFLNSYQIKDIELNYEMGSMMITFEEVRV